VPTAWVLVAGIAALLVVLALAVGLYRTHELGRGPEGPLLALGSTFVILGIVFGEDRMIGYGLIGAGVLISVAGAALRRGAGPG